MNLKFLQAGIVIFILLIANLAVADSMRCGKRLIKTGDSSATILLLCGEPMLRQVISIDEDSFKHKSEAQEYESSQIVKTERWTYNMGKGSFLKLLIIRNGVLERIENGERM